MHDINICTATRVELIATACLFHFMIENPDESLTQLINCHATNVHTFQHFPYLQNMIDLSHHVQHHIINI